MGVVPSKHVDKYSEEAGDSDLIREISLDPSGDNDGGSKRLKKKRKRIKFPSIAKQKKKSISAKEEEKVVDSMKELEDEDTRAVSSVQSGGPDSSTARTDVDHMTLSAPSSPDLIPSNDIRIDSKEDVLDLLSNKVDITLNDRQMEQLDAVLGLVEQAMKTRIETLLLSVAQESKPKHHGKVSKASVGCQATEETQDVYDEAAVMVLQEQVEKLQEICQSLEKNRRNLEEELSGLSEEKALREQHVSDLQEQARILEHVEIARLVNIKLGLDTELQQIQEQLENSAKERRALMDKELELLREEKLKVLMSELTDLRDEKMDNVNKELETLRSERDNLQSTVLKLKTQAENIEKRNEELHSQQQSELQEQLSSLQRELVLAERQLRSVKLEAEDKKSEIDAMVESARAGILKLQSNEIAVRETVEKLRDEEMRLKASCIELGQEKARLTSAVELQTKELTRLEGEVAETRKLLEQQNSQTSVMIERLSSCKEELVYAEQQLQENEKHHNELIGKVEQLREEKAQLELVKQTLLEQLVQYRDELDLCSKMRSEQLWKKDLMNMAEALYTKFQQQKRSNRSFEPMVILKHELDKVLRRAEKADELQREHSEGMESLKLQHAKEMESIRSECERSKQSAVADLKRELESRDGRISELEKQLKLQRKRVRNMQQQQQQQQGQHLESQCSACSYYQTDMGSSVRSSGRKSSSSRVRSSLGSEDGPDNSRKPMFDLLNVMNSGWPTNCATDTQVSEQLDRLHEALDDYNGKSNESVCDAYNTVVSHLTMLLTNRDDMIKILKRENASLRNQHHSVSLFDQDMLAATATQVERVRFVLGWVQRTHYVVDQHAMLYDDICTSRIIERDQRRKVLAIMDNVVHALGVSR